jgi:hypothetical protein
MPRLSLAVLVVTLLSTSLAIFPTRAGAQTDLDAFMKDVVARRDDNWKKLQQYILDEREEIILNGPAGLRLWGEQRDYTWFIRDGFFIKSPVKANGAAVGESDRRKFEDLYLQRVRRREGRQGSENAPPDSTGVGAVARPDNNDPSTSSEQAPEDTPTSVDGLIRQSRQPQFVSSSYFLRFKFDEGRYALAGRETFEGRDVLRIEYYPTRLFGDERRGGGRGRGRGRGRELSEKERQRDADFRKLLNKVAIVTLWVEPASKQIVKYTFDNVDFEFLPGQWLLTVDSLKASMTMSQPFKDVWLPKNIEIGAAMTLAIGQFTFRQTTSYSDYREANVKSRVIIK